MCIVHVSLVVGTVEVLAIPASGEVMDSHDTTLAFLGREGIKFRESRQFVLQTDEHKAISLLRSACRLANRHTESRLERCDLLPAVGAEIFLHVIDGHASIDAGDDLRVGHDRHTLIGSIGRMLVEHDGGPVVRKVIGEDA